MLDPEVRLSADASRLVVDVITNPAPQDQPITVALKSPLTGTACQLLPALINVWTQDVGPNCTSVLRATVSPADVGPCVDVISNPSSTTYSVVIEVEQRQATADFGGVPLSRTFRRLHQISVQKTAQLQSSPAGVRSRL